jgi:hypothetical protein
MMKTILFFIFWLLFLFPLSFAEGYKFEPSEIEKKIYHLGGFGEFRPALNVLDKAAPYTRPNTITRM